MIRFSTLSSVIVHKNLWHSHCVAWKSRETTLGHHEIWTSFKWLNECKLKYLFGGLTPMY